MKNIFKQNLLIIIIILILSIIETFLFIYMPNYIKDTINYSVEKKGIETHIPEIISIRSMNSFSAIMQNEEIKEYYELINKNDEKYVNKYEILNNQDIYILKDLSKAEEKKLNELLLKATSLYTMFNQSEELKNMNFRPDATVINYYMGLTDDNEIKKIYSSFEDLDKSTKENNAISFVIEEYQNLKFNLKDIQKSYLYKKSLNVILIFVIILALMVIINSLSRKLVNRISIEYKKVNKDTLTNIIKNIILIPVILIGSIINIFILNWKLLIILFIVIALIILLSFILKNKLPINSNIYKKIMLFIKPGVLFIMTTIGIITMLTIPENINVSNIISIINYLIELILVVILFADLLRKKEVK